jgi:hypothetical protein
MPAHLSKDRSSLCSFSFADGRRCRTPRTPSHPHLCTFHARKEAQARASDQVGREISSYFSGTYLSACDLSSALGHLFSAVAQGHIKPKSASILAYLSQTLVQSIHLAEHEYISAFGADSWRRVVRSSFAPPAAASPDLKLDPAASRCADPHTRPTRSPLPILRRINTYKLASKQMTSTTCEMNTCEKS